MKTAFAALLPLALPFLCSLVIAVLVWAAQKLHELRLTRDVAARTLRDKFVATLVDLVDDFASAQVAGIREDIQAAQADGKVTPEELKGIAAKEWARIRAYFTPAYLATVAKALGISLDGLGALAVQTITDKLSPRLAPAK